MDFTELVGLHISSVLSLCHDLRGFLCSCHVKIIKKADISGLRIKTSQSVFLGVLCYLNKIGLKKYLDFTNIDFSHSACEICSFSNIQAVPDHPLFGLGKGDTELFPH